VTAILKFEDLAKSWFGVPAVSDVNLSVEEGTLLGLIGQNGAGKSTLMNMLGGVVQPSSGGMEWRGQPYSPSGPADARKAGIGFIHQELNLFTNLSIAENLFVDGFPRKHGFLDKATMLDRARGILSRLSLDLDPKVLVGQLSPGERQLVEIGKALHHEASLIIFDEPTTSLTPREVNRLFDTIAALRKDGSTIIYISHILGEVMRLADHVAVMRDGRLVDDGKAADFTISRMIRSMIGRDLSGYYPPRSCTPGEKAILELEGVSQPGVIEDVSLTIRQREVLGLFGLMGAGRTELARVIFGLDPHASGAIKIDGQGIAAKAMGRIASGLAFVTENRREEGLMLDASISDNLALVALESFGRGPLGVVEEESLATRAAEVKSELQIKAGNIATQPVKALSGGNQQKVVIGKWKMREPRLFILDEPTRGVDVGAKYEIYTLIDQLAASGGAVLFISSELEEVMGMADRIIVMNRGEVVGEIARPDFEKEKILAMAFKEEPA
jgi:ribose transport system ATP-binding protein